MRANQHKPAPELGWGRNYDFALRVAPAVRRMGWVEVGVGRRWSGRRCVDLGSRRLRQSERTLGYVGYVSLPEHQAACWGMQNRHLLL